MLVALTQPHFAHYDWKAPDADAEQRLRPPRRLLRPRRRQSPVGRLLLHQPQRLRLRPGHEPRPDRRRPRPAGPMGAATTPSSPCGPRRSSHELDPGRIVYHHAGGNIGSMHTSNFYPNFAPVQELSDWFAHWATAGVKPAFLCEYGAPFTWDWTMYRGWYKGEREFGSAAVPWEFCLAEWDAQFLGDRAFAVGEREKAQPPLGGRAVRGRQDLAPLGLPHRSRLAEVRGPPDGPGGLPGRQLARLPHLGRVGHFALGVRRVLDAPRWRQPATRATQSRLGRPAAPGLQPRFRRGPRRTD